MVDFDTCVICNEVVMDIDHQLGSLCSWIAFDISDVDMDC